MATVHLSGTQLEPETPSVPLNKRFMAALAVMFVVAMHIFTPNPGGAGLALSFNPTTWIAFSIAAALGLYQLGSNQRLRYSKLTIGLLVSCLLLTVPIFFPDSQPEYATGRLIGLWAGYLLFVALQQFKLSNKHKLRLLWLVVIAVTIEAMLGYIQYFLLSPGNPFGYDTIANRPYGIFQQPNVMASFLATGLVLSAYLLSRQPVKYHNKLSATNLLYALPLLTVPLLVVLASRTGWLGAALATALILPYLYRYATRRRMVGWLISLFLGIVLGLIAGYLQGSDSLMSDKADLDSPRRYTFPQTLDMVIEKPFTGYGYGRFESQYMLYTARQHQLNPDYPPGLPAMDHPHNELLFWSAEGGLLPLIGIVFAAGMVLFRIYTAKKGTRTAMFALFVPIVLHSQLEYPFYHSAIHWLTFVILLFWIDQRVARYKAIRFSNITKALLRVSSLVLPVVTCVYMLSALHTNYILTQFEHSKPKNPDILRRISNPVVWKDRFDWDVYSSYLQLGLTRQDPALITPYIQWSQQIIRHKPRPVFYRNLILAYQGLGDDSRAKQTLNEALYLFPLQDFDQLQSHQTRSDSVATQGNRE